MADKRRTKPPHEPTKATRDTVSMHTLVGTAQPDVARIIGIDEKTLRKHYRDELDLAHEATGKTFEEVSSVSQAT